MPICKRQGFDDAAWQGNNETFRDNDMVFCCHITKRIFRDYETYFRHVMLINSTIWQCESTGRDHLTFEEALKSEKAARKRMELFKDSLRPPVMLVIEHAKQSAIKTLNNIVLKFLRRRYFLNEEVTIAGKKSALYKVVEIIPPKDLVPGNGVYEETDLLQYRLRTVEPSDKPELVVPFEQVRRQRTEFTTENMQMFVKNNVTRVDGLLCPKSSSYKCYVTDRNITFASIFIGNMPRYTPAKIRKPNKKQTTLNEFLVKNGGNLNEKKKIEKKIENKVDNKVENKIEKKTEKKIDPEQVKNAEKRAKLLERVDVECDAALSVTDDLERTDQRMLPTYTPIKTILPTKLIGDAFMLREFMHTYAGILSGINVFRKNLSFHELTRAFTQREVAGPLSDILLILIGTIFDLQREEEQECAVQYRNCNLSNPVLRNNMTDAARCHSFVKHHYSYKVNELPLDALTLSEVLRLHFLSSGSIVADRADKWRVMYRNGYSSSEDPGLNLRMQHAHILRLLKNYPIYHFPFRDIMCVIRCLMAQILTYSTTINLIEERKEETAKALNDLRSLVAAENKRLAAVELQRRKMTLEHNQQCMNPENKIDNETKEALTEKLNKKIAELLAQSDRNHRKHEEQLIKVQSEVFNFLTYLGMDRAYRKYYVLESMPGIFVEHPPDSMDTCLENPPINMVHIDVNRPTNRKHLRAYLIKMYTEEDNKNKIKVANKSQENKENQVHPVNGLTNGTHDGVDTSSSTATMNGVDKMDVDDVVETKPPTAYQLFMCTGDKRNCIVHDERNADRQRWAYFYKKEDIDALIASLNNYGYREKDLLKQILMLRHVIEKHVATCPFDMLSLKHEKAFSNFQSAVMSTTHRQYGKANFDFLLDENGINGVMCFHLIDRLIQFESEIYTGDLGRLKVKDMIKWRDDLIDNQYDPQVKLQWGHIEENSLEESNSDEENSEDVYFGYGKPFVDPGQNLGASLEIDSEDSADDEIPMHVSDTVLANVKALASALLQIEQAIEQRFLNAPFGVSKTKNKEIIEKQQKDGQRRLKQWEISLMESTSYSQVFLHLNILYDSIIWARSTNKSMCSICKRGNDPEQMLLCDECNGGTHMFCMKPKMKTVPEGKWYCKRCVSHLGFVNESDDTKKKTETKKKRKFIVENGSDDEEEQDEEDNTNEEEYDNDSNASWFSSKNKKRPNQHRTKKRLKSKDIEATLNGSEAGSDQEEEEDDDEEHDDNSKGNVEEDVAEEANETGVEGEEDEEEENVCLVCSYDGGDLTCARCKQYYHLECVNLKRHPRNEYVCKTCKSHDKPKSKPSHDNNEDDDENNDEPRAKRPRSSRNSLRNSLPNGNVNNNNSTNNNNNNNRRSHRRTNEDLPLNSSALYELLEQTMKHKLSWPFLRPVMPSEVPDYHEIIKEPMDLAKVKSKLNMGKYQINEEVLNDIQLIFRNCHEYNEEDNEIYEAGSILERFVIDRCSDLHLTFKPSEMNAHS